MRPLRWFTPHVEVDLCGHATLASAHALWETGRLAADEVAAFDTRSGPAVGAAAPRGLDRAGLPRPARRGHGACPPACATGWAWAAPRSAASAAAGWTLLVELRLGGRRGRGCAPTSAACAEIETRAVIVTAAGPRGDGGAGAATSCAAVFGPRVGIDEDPVTGSAQCVLVPYWAERLGRRQLRARQLSARGGLLDVRLGSDGAADGRVGIAGRAVTTLRGRLAV